MRLRLGRWKEAAWMPGVAVKRWRGGMHARAEVGPQHAPPILLASAAQ